MATVIYRGRSLLGSGDVVAVAPAVSSNTKTGDVVGVYILPLRGATSPRPCCCPTDCPLQGAGCYVHWGFAPTSLHKAAAGQRVATPAELAELGAGRMVRLGQAGDPAAVPARVWNALLRRSSGHVAYSHAWRLPRFQWLQRLAMASVENRADRALAESMGWRTYRIRSRGSEVGAGEIDCPSSRGVQCADCGLCNGANGAPSISIPAHGGAVAARVAQRIAE